MQATQHASPEPILQKTKLRVCAHITDNFMMGGQTMRLLDADSFLENHVIDSTRFLKPVRLLGERYGFAAQENGMTPQNLDNRNNAAVDVERKFDGRLSA